MSTLEIRPDVNVSSSSMRLEFELRPTGNSPSKRLFYEVAGANEAPRVFDGVLCAVVHHAMRERMKIRLFGPATKEAILNLREYQLAWARWCPSEYQPVEIEADALVDPATGRGASALAAFSGGVDATFTLFTHMPSAPGLHRPLSACLLVQGFDIDIDDRSAFSSVLNRAKALHERLGVQTLSVRTNSRALGLQNWEHSHAGEIAGCLHLFSPRFSQALIGSTDPYDALVLPWGSNPITDHLLSAGGMQIVHDGAGYSRTEKVAFLARYPEAIRGLRVCYAGIQKDRNCGVCEKCVRTQMNFLAVGIGNPECFPKPFDLALINAMVIGSDVQFAELRSILDYTYRNGVSGEWVRRLRARVRSEEVRSGLRKGVKNALNSVGLLRTAILLKQRLSVLRGFVTRSNGRASRV